MKQSKSRAFFVNNVRADGRSLRCNNFYLYAYIYVYCLWQKSILRYDDFSLIVFALEISFFHSADAYTIRSVKLVHIHTSACIAQLIRMNFSAIDLFSPTEFPFALGFFLQ